jgi:hypothetical protein
MTNDGRQFHTTVALAWTLRSRATWLHARTRSFALCSCNTRAKYCGLHEKEAGIQWRVIPPAIAKTAKH